MAKISRVEKKEVKEDGIVTVKYCDKLSTEKPAWRCSINVSDVPVFINGVLLYDGTDDKDPRIRFPWREYERDGKKEYPEIASCATKEMRELITEAFIECFSAISDGSHDISNPYNYKGIQLSYMTLNPIPSSENVLMRASVNVSSDVFISNIIAREREDGSLWIAYPQRAYEKDGEKKYSPIAGPASSEANRLITEAVTKEIRK